MCWFIIFWHVHRTWTFIEIPLDKGSDWSPSCSVSSQSRTPTCCKLIPSSVPTRSNVTSCHMTSSHVIRSHVIGSHITRNHVTGSCVTGSHVTGSHMTGSGVLIFCVNMAQGSILHSHSTQNVALHYHTYTLYLGFRKALSSEQSLANNLGVCQSRERLLAPKIEQNSGHTRELINHWRS